MDIESHWFVIINPVAGSGNGLSDWPTISKLLRDNNIVHEYAFTEHQYHATELAVESIKKGYRQIIVVGGDGTIHEVVNGLFIQEICPSKEVLISVIAVGTGNDWIRMFGIPRKYSEAIKAIVAGHYFLQDIGRISYHNASYKQTRYMANVAGIGFDAYVNKQYNHLKQEGKYSRWLYIWCAIKAVMAYSATGVKIYIDQKLVINDLVYSGTIGIGKYNGGGMIQNPNAVADDGLFDVTVIRKLSKIRIFRHFNALYNGRIFNVPKVILARGRNIRIESSPEIAVEVDGEALGYSPFEFDIIDKAIKVVVSEKFLNRDMKKAKQQPNN